MGTKAKVTRVRGNASGGMLPWLGLAFILLLADQFTKVLIVGHYQLGDSTPVTSFFNIVRVHNTGAAFSFLADAGGWQLWFFTVLAVGISGLLGFWLSRTARGDWRQALPYALVIGGALGNVIDRFAHGHVVDFIQWYVGTHYWPAFNIADCAVVGGAIGMALFGLLGGKPASKQG